MTTNKNHIARLHETSLLLKGGLLGFLLSLLMPLASFAQYDNDDDGFTLRDEDPVERNMRGGRVDTTKQKKEAPRGMYVWTIDEKFGERHSENRDTLQHLFMNTIFTTGMHGEYNTTGNLGAPRQNRIFTDRKDFSSFLFANPFSYFYTPVEELRFTNTLSPITLVNYNSCGDKQNGEDHLKVMYAVNAGKRIGAGMKFDYIYGMGYYSNQSTSLFDWTLWGSYLGDRYQAHLIFSTNHSKITENGGITNDDYVKHPEAFDDNFTANEIPVNLSQNWNRLDSKHLFLTHRYNIGFSRKVPMTEEEIKARKFAMASEKENNERKRKEEAEKNGEKADAKKPAQTFSGRPDDAKIAGDLNVDSIAKANAEKRKLEAQAMTDSLIQQKDTLAEDTTWMKDEYVPVTSFIHTLKFDGFNREYIAKESPANYYAMKYNLIPGDFASTTEETIDHYQLRNTFALGMLEGFNKWMKTGIKLYVAHDMHHYVLPDSVSASSKYNEMTFFGGAQLIKSQGRTLHYNATAELGLLGENIGDLKIDATGDVNVALFGDTTRLNLYGFFHREKPKFLHRHYHSRHFRWDDDDLSSLLHTHLEGKLTIGKTNTSFRMAYDNITNYTYLAINNSRSEAGLPIGYSAAVRQTNKNLSLLTAEIGQDVRWGILNWENRITFQKSTDEDILPVPLVNVWTNLYLNFKIARVLKCHFGAEATYFTEYNAPEYCGQLASFAIQENDKVREKVGNYPFINAYANFVLKGCRFFVMMSHINGGSGSRNYFTTPHYPMNERIFRIGLSWYFHN